MSRKSLAIRSGFRDNQDGDKNGSKADFRFMVLVGIMLYVSMVSKERQQLAGIGTDFETWGKPKSLRPTMGRRPDDDALHRESTKWGKFQSHLV